MARQERPAGLTPPQRIAIRALADVLATRLQQVADVQAKLLRDYETNLKSNSYLATQLLFKYQYNDDVGPLFALDQFYKKLTPAAIQAAAKLYLNPANVVKVSLFPEKT